jgi:hypothetical protein
LAAVLDSAGVPSRLAVGVVGRDGRALPGLHAWVEYWDEPGMWLVADASVGSVRALAPADGDPESSRTPGEARPAAGTARGEGWLAHPATHRGLLAAVAVLVGLLSLALWWRRRVSRRLAIDDSIDASEVMRGALRRPASFAHAPAVFTRPLVPLLGDRRVSLQRARALAERGELFRSERSPELARRAASRGAAVIDGSKRRGQAVAGLLGAVDLDRWGGVVERCAPTTFTTAVDQVLREHREPWRVRVVDDAPSALASLEIPSLDLALVVLDGDSPLCAGVAATHRDRPALAELLLVDAVTHEVGMSAERRGHLLAAAASRAVIEETRP